MIRKLSKWLSLPVAGLYIIAPIMSWLNGEFEGMSLFEIIKDIILGLIVVGIALAFIWYEFRAGSKLFVLFCILVAIFAFPIRFSFILKELGEGTIRFLNMIFHLVGWFILLVPILAMLIYRP